MAPLTLQRRFPALDRAETVVAVVGAFTIVWAWQGTSGPALVLAFGLLTVSMPAGYGLLRRMVLAGGVYVAYSLLIATVFSMVSVPLPPAFFVSGLVVGAAAVARRCADRRIVGTAGDLPILLFVVIAAWIALRWGIGAGPAELVLQLSRGGDNANHLNLVRTIQLDQGYQYGSDRHGLLPGMDFYPQGFAFLVAYTGLLVSGTLPTVAELVQQSWVMFMLQPTVAVLLVLLTVRGLLLRGGTSTVRLPLLLAGLVVTPLLIATVYANLATYGFQTQMFAMNATLAAVWLATDPLLGHRRWVTVGIAGTVLATASSWFLLVPVAGAVLLVTAWPLLRRAAEQPVWWWAGMLVAGVASWYPVRHSNPDSTGQLVAHGGVRVIDDRLWQLLLVLTVLVLVFEIRRLRGGAELGLPGTTATPALAALSVALLSSVLLSLGVAAFQMKETGEVSYYFFKTLYLPVALAMIPLGLGAARAVGLVRPMRPSAAAVRIVAVAVALPCLAGLRALAQEVWEPYMVEPLRGPVDTAVIEALMVAHPYALPEDEDIVATAYCSYLESGQLTSWIGALFSTWDAPRKEFYEAVDRPRQEDPADLADYIGRETHRTVTVYLQTSCETAGAVIAALPPGTPVVDTEPVVRRT